MTTKTQLQSKIQELEAELQAFKTQLNNYQELTLENANPGDVLPDGTVVIQKSNGLALLAAPKETEVHCAWSKEFADVFTALKGHGLNPSQWFIPTKEQLNLAYEVAKEHFANTIYWSSTEFNATCACSQGFGNGGIISLSKSAIFCVRAFRCVTY
jgi:hypothetical protein